MAVMLQTSQGEIIIDLHVDLAPNACKNFLKLCKIKYYNNCLFHNVQPNFIVQSGDPTGTGKGGESIFGKLYGEQARFFPDEISPKLKHRTRGTVGMASAGPDLNGSQFYITTRDVVDTLDEKKTIFGQVAEGLDVLDRINEAYCDDNGRPWANMRILHTIILDDPFDDPAGLSDHIPDASPDFRKDPDDDRPEDDWTPEDDGRDPEEVEKEKRRKEAKSRAVVLEMIGDLPEADARPPDNQLFVCKLNPVTTDEDLEIIFSRFGKVTSCDIVRDYKTGDSLCYAFVTFDTPQQAEAAYLKMDNVLIDDRRIHVDFSQSMHNLWQQYKRFGKKGGRAEDGEEASRFQGGGGRGRGRGRGDGTFQSASGRQVLEYKGGPGLVLQGQFGGPQQGGGRGGGGRGEPRPGRGAERGPDWQCPNPRCGFSNFGFRAECNKCGTAKGAEVPPDDGGRGRGPPPPRDDRGDRGGRDDREDRHRDRDGGRGGGDQYRGGGGGGGGGRRGESPPPPRERERERDRGRDDRDREKDRDRERDRERDRGAGDAGKHQRRERSRSRDRDAGRERSHKKHKEHKHKEREKERRRSRSRSRSREKERRRDDRDRR